MTNSDPYREGFMRIGAIYSGELCRMGEDFYQVVRDNASVRSALLTLYGLLVKSGICTRLEDLDATEKDSLWTDCKNIFPGARKQLLIELCKCLHALGTYITKVENNE